uniref:Uncharacterized protein n=1 Tax=Sphaerodactylus townsendi TaxID=933632 RepID=A0ACB8EDC5_9SAUR
MLEFLGLCRTLRVTSKAAGPSPRGQSCHSALACWPRCLSTKGGLLPAERIGWESGHASLCRAERSRAWLPTAGMKRCGLGSPAAATIPNLPWAVRTLDCRRNFLQGDPSQMLIHGVCSVLYQLWSARATADASPVLSLSYLRTQSTNEGSFIEKMKKTGRNIVVFYGSQTGTAEEFANRLAKDAHRYGMRGMSADPEEYDLSDLSRLAEIEKALAVFCMATYGEGDPTDNAQDFYDWLQETDANLSGIKFAVFGLGNKTYEHFNAMGKYVDKRLEELGAQRIFELGLGDDDGNLEEDFITWREQFWPAVCEHFGVEATGDESSIRQYELVILEDINMNKVYTGEMGRLKSYESQKPPFDAKNPFLAPVSVNRKLNQGGDRHFMHLELDINGSKIRYESGDHIAVYAANETSIVNQLGEILGANLDTVISLNNLDEV